MFGDEQRRGGTLYGRRTNVLQGKFVSVNEGMDEIDSLAAVPANPRQLIFFVGVLHGSMVEDETSKFSTH